MGYPSVFPTGTTVYNPNKCWNGYTIYPAIGVILLGGKGQGEDSVRSTKIREGVGGFDQPIQECIESDALDGD